MSIEESLLTNLAREQPSLAIDAASTPTASREWVNKNVDAWILVDEVCSIGAAATVGSSHPRGRPCERRISQHPPAFPYFLPDFPQSPDTFLEQAIESSEKTGSFPVIPIG